MNLGKNSSWTFAGDTLGYVDVQTGELVKVQTFVSTVVCTDYTFAIFVPSQKTEEFLYAPLVLWKHSVNHSSVQSEGCGGQGGQV